MTSEREARQTSRNESTLTLAVSLPRLGNGSDFPPPTTSKTCHSASYGSPGALPKGYCVTRSPSGGPDTQKPCFQQQACIALLACAARRLSVVPLLHGKHAQPKPPSIPAPLQPGRCKVNTYAVFRLQTRLHLGLKEKLAKGFQTCLARLHTIAERIF